MLHDKKIGKLIITALVFALITVLMPMQASGEVAPISELEDKLEGISEEERAVLEELFTLQQEIDALEQEEDKINGEIEDLQAQIEELGEEIDKKQEEYDLQLDILRQVLVQYQRGGPASHLEILLKADSLSEFIKSLNILKDMSHNVNDLLASLEEGKQALQEERSRLNDKTVQQEKKKEELLENLHTKQRLQQEQETYLASLQEDREYYEEQLGNVKQVWADCRTLFAGMVEEITGIIGSGYFTAEDLNIEYGFFTIHGHLKEETFNRIISENSALLQTVFHFEENQVIIEVPEKRLVLTGNFVIAGESAIQFEVETGTFYDMPLEDSAVKELFQNGPLLIDFKSIAGDMVIINFKINEVESKDGTLDFIIMPQF
jgi:peptidoglycan hydrolase CwlO-like protein